jgi:hypothetical protein
MKNKLQIIVSLLIVCLFSLMSVPTYAQGNDESIPLRQPQPEAPQRSPVIIQEMGPLGVAQTVVELPAEADAYIASARPNENFGKAALFVGYHILGDDHFGAQRSLLRFDLSPIPEGAAILEARMQLYLSFATLDDTEEMRIIARQLNSAWDEQFVTWNTEPEWGEVRAETFVGTSQGWYEWDLTDLVSDWVSTAAINHGVELIGDEEIQQRERAFNSRETQTDLYPRLLVRYTEEVDTEPPVVTVNPLPEFSPRNFTVSWSGTDPGGSGIAHYDVQVRVDSGDWIDWITSTTATSAEFTGGESGRTYEFRARGVDNAGNVEAFGDAEAITTVDVRPPVSQIDPLPPVTSESSFVVAWSGTDVGAGIAYYDVRYRYEGGPWVLWQHQTEATSAIFTAMQDGTYEFEVRAVDRAGLVEPFTGEQTASITVEAGMEIRVWLPIIYNMASPAGEE